MAAAIGRKSARRWLPWRKPLSPDSLKMMVLSGVVRRADLAPPLLPTRTVYWHDGDASTGEAPASGSGPGWLSRWLGRKAPAESPHRA